MNGQLARLDGTGASQVRRFVESGGTYLSSCAGTYNVLEIDPRFENGWNAAHRELPMLSARSWLTDPDQSWGLRSPGIGVIRAAIGTEDHPLTVGLPPSLDVVYYNGPILEPTDPALQPLLVCLAPDGQRFTPGEALHGPASDALPSTWMQQACDEGLLGGAYQAVGEGWIVGFGLHPEFGPDPDMLAWERPARLLANAATWASRRPVRDPRPVVMHSDESTDVVGLLETGRVSGDRIAAALARLRDLSTDPLPDWLSAEAHPRPAFGRDVVTLWKETTEGARTVAATLATDLERWYTAYESTPEPTAEGGREDRDRSRRLLTAAPLEPAQDLGFKGVPALLDEVETLLDTLTAGGVQGRYRAVAMSYLSAAGILGDTRLLLGAAHAWIDRSRFATVLPAPAREPRRPSQI